MFTVCPKCALTLVVTAQDLRVAQGYVRCGRCSNVFNAIVGLTDDRGALAGNDASTQGTASTSIIRKAPSISEDEKPIDSLSETGESEEVYAEPDAEEVKFQEVFTETPAPPPGTATPPSRAPGPIAFILPPPGPPVKAQLPAATTSPPAKTPSEPEKRYSDTEGIEAFPDSELEFNPQVTDVTKVFIEAAPIAFKGDATGQFKKVVPGTEPPAPKGSPASPPAAGSPGTAQPPGQAASKSSATATRRTQPGTPATPPAPPKPAPPARDAEDVQIENELRSLAARLDATSSRPAPKFPAAANEESTPNGAASENDGAGDIYAKATPRPRDTPKPAVTTQRVAALPSAAANSGKAIGDDAEAQSDGALDTFTPATAPRPRFMLWVAGAAVLSLALVAQAIHHNRHELATNALLNRPLTRFYKAIGVPLVPSWDLLSYDVRQLGASSEGGEGTLTVRASLKNNATQPLPLPLLRITMQDRYGNRIATRDVPPSGYVPGAVPAEAHLGVGQRIDAEMTFKDPGQNAVGFEIDACLQTATGRIACANDAPAATPR
ncbi:MAG: DUF3426 domain-containing protein [Gammaproteobacteria bacterium]